MRAKPARWVRPEPEMPRSSSKTLTLSRGHPRSTARAAKWYCRAVDSRLFSTCVLLDWRTETTAHRRRWSMVILGLSLMVVLRLSDCLRDQLGEHRYHFGPLLVVECVPHRHHAVGCRHFEKAQLLHGYAPAVSTAAEHPQPEVDPAEHLQPTARGATACRRQAMRAEAACRREPTVASFAGQSRRPVSASAYHQATPKSDGARRLGAASRALPATAPQMHGADERWLLAWDSPRGGGGQSVEWFFANVRHDVLLGKIARKVQDPKVLHLVKLIIKASGKKGVPQGGPLSPLAANIYLNEVDWYFDDLRRKTAQEPYEAINYHRFADDMVITVSGHWSKRGWAERALQRLQEQLETLRVELNREKTKMVDTLKGEAFGFLGFDLRRVHKRKKDGYTIPMTPKKKARKIVKAKIRDIIRSGGAVPVAVIVSRVNAVVAGWVNYFRVGNSSRAFSEVRDYLEMKIRTLLTRRKRRRKVSIGWRRWSNEYVYGVLGLYWDWKIHPLPSATAYA